MRSMRDIMYEFSWQQGASYLAYSPTYRPIIANLPKIRHFSYNAENQYITSDYLHQEPAFRAFLSQKHCYKGEICMLLHAYPMQIGHQNDASTARKVGIFLVKLEFSASKTSCLLPVCLLIFSRLHYFNCRFRGIKQTKYWTNLLLRSIIFQQRKTRKKLKISNDLPQKHQIKHHKSWWWNTTKVYDEMSQKLMMKHHNSSF